MLRWALWAALLCPAGALRALVPVATGSEEIELTAIANVWRRAGWDVTIAAIDDHPVVTCARGQRILADAAPDDLLDAQFEAIALPGGMPGASNLAACEPLLRLLRRHKVDNRWYGAICASPAVVFAQAAPDLLPSRATCHPAFSDALEQAVGCTALDERVVVDEAARCVTSRGPGTAIEFALELVRLVEGDDAANNVSGPMCV